MTAATTGPGRAAGRWQRHRRQFIGIDGRADDRGLVEAEALAELGEEACLGLVAQPVGIAHADREFVGQATQLLVTSRRPPPLRRTFA